jgi:hypothetical protein
MLPGLVLARPSTLGPGKSVELDRVAGHPHHRWLEETAEQIQRDYDRLHAAASVDPQRAGHGGETTWAGLLRSWLPPQYEIVARKYILPEVGDDAFEMDLVVLSPGYPSALREREEILAGGVAAAFSVRLTADAAALTDALDRAVRLRRGLKRRFVTPRAQLVGPYPIGLLSHVHAWTQPTSTPMENVRATLENAHSALSHPIEMLDYVCIANLATWTFAKLPYTPPNAMEHSPIATDVQRREGAVMTSVMGSDNPSTRAAVAVLVAALYERLSYFDPQLRSVADGLRLTDTLGSASGLQRLWNLSDIFDTDIIRQLQRAAFPVVTVTGKQCSARGSR